MEFIAAGFDPNAFGTLTLRQVQRWLEGAARRDALTMAQTARAVWAGAQLNGKGVDEFVTAVLGREPEKVPPEQAVFALRTTTDAIPKVNWNDMVKPR